MCQTSDETETKIRSRPKRVSELKREVFRSSTCEDKANKLKNEIGAKDMQLREFLCSFASVCQEASAMLPLLPAKQEASPGKRRRREMIPSSRKPDPASVLFSLSNSLTKLRSEFLTLLRASTYKCPCSPRHDGTTRSPLF